MKDELKIDYKEHKINFPLTYGYLDGIDEVFNFKTNKSESLEKFKLNLDNDEMEMNQYLLLEEMAKKANEVDVELNLDGLEYKGKGKVSHFFSVNGLNINLILKEII
ncbi:MAG: hypothetical protein PHX18_08050 [Candidatus Gastranaerophilales bacterium]|nr:hypothetical protein [Candidatus Gastranaerophilales bacterium]